VSKLYLEKQGLEELEKRIAQIDNYLRNRALGARQREWLKREKENWSEIIKEIKQNDFYL